MPLIFFPWFVWLPFLTKSQSFDFTNKDPEATFWGQNLLAQRVRESIQLTFFLSQLPRNLHSPTI